MDETKEAKQAEERSPWKDLSTAIMEERWVEFLKTSKNSIHATWKIFVKSLRQVQTGGEEGDNRRGVEEDLTNIRQVLIISTPVQDIF